MVSYDDVLLVPLSSSLSSSLDMLPTLSHTSDDCNGTFPAPPKANHDVVGEAGVFSMVTVRELLFPRALLKGEVVFLGLREKLLVPPFYGAVLPHFKPSVVQTTSVGKPKSPLCFWY